MAPSSRRAAGVGPPRRGSLGSVLRAGGPAVAQGGVLGGSPVQLKNGLVRTKAKADLGAGGAPPLYPGFIPGGSDDLRWAAKKESLSFHLPRALGSTVARRHASGHGAWPVGGRHGGRGVPSRSGSLN